MIIATGLMSTMMSAKLVHAYLQTLFTVVALHMIQLYINHTRHWQYTNHKSGNF